MLKVLLFIALSQGSFANPPVDSDELEEVDLLAEAISELESMEQAEIQEDQKKTDRKLATKPRKKPVQTMQLDMGDTVINISNRKIEKAPKTYNTVKEGRFDDDDEGEGL